jgi:hypothetical protein
MELTLLAIDSQYRVLSRRSTNHISTDAGSHGHRLTGSKYLLAQCQEPDHLQSLSDIWDLLAQSLAAALSVRLHELVLGDHLLEVAESGLDFLAGGNVVANIVDERCDGNSARVGLCCYRAVWRGQSSFFPRCG